MLNTDTQTKTVETIGAELAALVKGQVHIDIYNRVAFSTDASIYRILPQCVVAPNDAADIVAVVNYARDNNIPIAPRGAGSGLAGESLTSGIVIDVRRHMNKILQTAPGGSWVRVQPGVVLDTLNVHLARWGRIIGPDPSSGNRAVMGGVVANNATGAHSLQYGYIAEYVQSVRCVLADGATAEFVNDTRPGDSAIAKACFDLLADKQDIIEKAQPKTKRNRCGYSIQGIIRDGRVDMAKLMAGSEGTLAVFTDITLRTVPVPKAKGLVQFEFASFGAMAKAVAVIVECGASACELMDRALMDMARGAFPKYREVLPADCAATLLVEHIGDDKEAIETKIADTIKTVGNLSTGSVKVLDEDKQALLWKSRKDAVPLLNRQKGLSHPVAFIEDVSVDYTRLDEYIAGLETMADKYDIPMAFYGHAGDGELHIRPYLDLRKEAEVTRMQDMAQEVFSLAWSLGGSISGEHGDGLLRAAFIEAQYGKDYYELLKGVKRIFDPTNLLNPGKVICDDPDIMSKNLRATALAGADDFQTELNFDPDEFRFEVEQCNGCGVCLASGQGSRMCPVFRGAGEELSSTRAKANLLSAWMASEKSGAGFDPKELKRILSLCVNCKMCSIECPAGVDVSKLVIEARTKLARYSGFTAAEFALAYNRWLSFFGSLFVPLSNWVLSLGITRWVLQKLIGLDRHRPFPKFDHGSFLRKANRYLRQHSPVKRPVDKVVYFVDSFANFNDHELGFAVLKVLRKRRVEVVVPKQRPVPLPAFVYGNIKAARRDMEYNLKQIAPFVKKGYKMVCSEPSAALCLKDELRLIIDSDDARLVSQNTFELMDYLSTQTDPKGRNLIAGGETTGRKALVSEKAPKGRHICKYGYHAPCHLKALRSSDASMDLLKQAGFTIVDIDGGCCGLAGTAGMQKKNRQLAEAIGGRLSGAIADSGADIIVTECAACAMQIQHLTHKQVIHPIKLLASKQ
ncbi:MAG: FAD-binding protein [Phycisphaerae bacterium]|nr:FAD-binding protein [Phycisphaerae bacterium]